LTSDCVTECTPEAWHETSETTLSGYLLAETTICDPADCSGEGCETISDPPDPNLSLSTDGFLYKVTWYVDCGGVIASPDYQTNIASCVDDDGSCVQSTAWSDPVGDPGNEMRYWTDCINNCGIYGCSSEEIEVVYGTDIPNYNVPPDTTDICPP